MNKMNLMTVLLACLALGACSNDDEQVPQQPEPQPLPEQTYPLTIEVTENPMTVDGEEGSASRRTDIATGSTLTTFKMDYVYDTSETGSVTATKDEVDGKWKSDDGWPSTGETVYWYAYTDGTFNVNSGNPYINFTVDEDVSSQKDLLVAKASGTYSETSGNLALTFDHACSALRFFIKKSTNLNDYKLDVSEVVLCNVVKHAKYYYATGWGDLYDERSVYTLFSGTAQTLGSASTDWIPMDGGTPCYLFMIPQKLKAWNHTTAIASVTNQTYLKIRCTLTKTTPSTVIVNDDYVYIPFGATLVGGTKYKVNINIGKNSLYNSSGSLIIPAS